MARQLTNLPEEQIIRVGGLGILGLLAGAVPAALYWLTFVSIGQRLYIAVLSVLLVAAFGALAVGAGREFLRMYRFGALVYRRVQRSRATTETAGTIEPALAA